MNTYAEIFNRVIRIVKECEFDDNLRCISPGRYEGDPSKPYTSMPDKTFGPYRVYKATFEERAVFNANPTIYVLYIRDDGFVGGSWCNESIVNELKEESSEYDE